MAKNFEINKGILKPLEFYGLRAQYIAFAIAGFVIAFILYMLIAFINSVVAIVTAVVFAFISIGVTFYLNNKFGSNGLAQMIAAKGTTKYVNNNKRIYKIIRHDSKICE